MSGRGASVGIRRSKSDARVTGWSIDSRTVAPGDLFFALRGPHHDGNVYVDEVLRKGAVAAVADGTVSRDREGAVVLRCRIRWKRCRARRFGLASNGAEK